MTTRDIPVDDGSSDDDELLIVEGLSSVSRPAIDLKAVSEQLKSSAVSEKKEIPPKTAAPVPILPVRDESGDRTAVSIAPAKEPTQRWTGDERTTVPIAKQKTPEQNWDGDDRTTVPISEPKVVKAPTTAPTILPPARTGGEHESISIAPPKAPGWDGDDRTIAPISSPQVAAATWDGDDRTIAPTSAPAKPAAWDGDDRTSAPTSSPAPAKSAAWDGDDRTIAPITPPLPAKPAAWDGDDRTVPPTSPAAVAAPAAIPQPAKPWEGDDRTIAPNGAPAARRAWDGDDRTAPPATSTRTAFAPSTAVPIPGRESVIQRKSEAAVSGTEGEWLHSGRQGPLTGRVLGDFAIGGILGEGGMGMVYRAMQLSLRRRAALKVLAANLASDDTLVRRFYAEAHTASRIASEHVVQVYFAGEVDGTVFFAMEFVEGSDLHQLAQAAKAAGGRLPLERALDFVAQAAEGLAAAGLRQVVHRDIKPQNLLVTPQGVLKIADFGIAKALDEQSLTLAGQTVGTPSYCSPEQGRGLPVDHRSDLYSLGVVLYELLTGEKPFAANSANALIYQHNYAEPKSPRSLVESIPATCEAVAMRLLMKDPGQRYQTAGELAADLRRLIAGTSPSVPVWTPAQGTGAKEALARDQGWRRKLLIPAIAAMIVIGAVSLWGFAQIAANRAEQQDILRRKQNLAVLDLAQPPPASAPEDIAWLLPRLGANEPELLRWQGKLERITELEKQLAPLDQEGPLPFEQRVAAEGDLARYVELVGNEGPTAQRWTNALDNARQAIARSADSLRVLDQEAPVDLATSQRLSVELDRHALLVGPTDTDLIRWRERLGRRAVRLDGLRGSLVRLEAPDAALREPDIEELDRSLAEWRQWTSTEDADANRWQAPITAFRERLAGVRARLQRLDRVDQPNLPLIEELASDLALCRSLTAAEDPQRRAWEAKVEATNERVRTLRTELSGLLDPTAPLTLDSLANAERLLGSYRAEVSPDDGRLAAWERRCASERRDLDSLRSTVVRLSDPAPLAAHERTVIRAAVNSLAERRAAGEAELAAWRERLAEADREVAALRDALSARAAAGTLHAPDATATADQLRQLAEADDTAASDLLSKREELIRLAKDLSSLDQIISEPTGAADKLAKWRSLMPAEDADGIRWSAKLQRIEAARSACAPIDEIREPPSESRASLSTLRDELVGSNDPAVLRWTERLKTIDDLQARIRTALAQPLAQTGTDKDIAALTALIGETPQITAWNARQAILVGPPAPSWASSSGSDERGRWIEVTVSGQPIRLRHIAAGTVRLGSPADEAGRDDDEAQVDVELTRSFWLAETEVSQRLWRAVMRSNPSTFTGPDRPVDCVSATEAADFCAQVAAKVPGFAARLPTEAEWEWACRVGSSGPFQGPDGDIASHALMRVAWFESTDGSHAVGRLAPNRLGLFDMHGNVWEWCADRYDRYPSQPTTDHLGTRGDQGVIRGGSWADPPDALRAANRVALATSARSRMVGFRIACTVEDVRP